MAQFLKFHEWKEQQSARQFNFNDYIKKHVTRIKDGEFFQIGDNVYFRKSGIVFSSGWIVSFCSDNISVLVKDAEQGFSSEAIYQNEINDLYFFGNEDNE